MHIALKFLLIIIAIFFLVTFGVFYYLFNTGQFPVEIIPDARTLYEGHVSIEHVNLADIKKQLEAQGCHAGNYPGEKVGTCLYLDANIPQLMGPSLEIFPRGSGFGPLSFFVSTDQIWAAKDIPGAPHHEKYKHEVRQDVDAVGDIFIIEEDSWKLTEIKYPWTAQY